MKDPADARRRWKEARQRVLMDGGVGAFEKDSLPSPLEAGAVRSFGWPKGQSADFLFPVDDEVCFGVHVQEFAKTWKLTVIGASAKGPVPEFEGSDAAAWAVAFGGVGGLFGALAASSGSKKETVITGIILGVVAGALVAGAVGANSRSRKRRAVKETEGHKEEESDEHW